MIVSWLVMSLLLARFPFADKQHRRLFYDETQINDVETFSQVAITIRDTVTLDVVRFFQNHVQHIIRLWFVSFGNTCNVDSEYHVLETY